MKNRISTDLEGSKFFLSAMRNCGVDPIVFCNYMSRNLQLQFLFHNSHYYDRCKSKSLLWIRRVQFTEQHMRLETLSSRMSASSGSAI